jgi:hypothetical protein
MNKLQLTELPVMKTGMLIRRPAADIFEAFVNPDTNEVLVHQGQWQA